MSGKEVQIGKAAILHAPGGTSIEGHINPEVGPHINMIEIARVKYERMNRNVRQRGSDRKSRYSPRSRWHLHRGTHKSRGRSPHKYDRDCEGQVRAYEQECQAKRFRSEKPLFSTLQVAPPSRDT